MKLRSIPSGFYSTFPQERVNALSRATGEQRKILMTDLPDWPMMSPGSLNAWLVFLGPSPGNSPGGDWNYDPLPSIGGPHPGVVEYVDGKGFWNGIRKYACAVFPELPPTDAYAATMVRNLDEEQTPPIPRDGRKMYPAANQVVQVISKLIRPRLVISLGSAREFTDSAFRKIASEKHSGTLLTARTGKRREWFSLMGNWEAGDAFLYVSASGIGPSMRQVSLEDTLDFLHDQSRFARSLG